MKDQIILKANHLFIKGLHFTDVLFYICLIKPKPTLNKPPDDQTNYTKHCRAADLTCR